MAEKPYHVRSNSLPTSSHPLMSRVEGELNKLKYWGQSCLTKETICFGLSGLNDLYNCVDDLLQLPLIQQAFAPRQQEQWVEELVDGSLRLLDICDSLRDVSLQMKEHLQGLQSILRRGRIEETDSRNKYICSVKKVKELSKSLKRKDNKCTSSRLSDQSQHVSEVITVLKEVRGVTISIFQSIFSFMVASMPKRKTSKWSLVSKLMHKAKVAREMEEEEKMTQKSLRELEVTIEGIEEGLEGMFRHLIQTRVSLLNILTW